MKNLKEWVDEWLHTYKRIMVKPSTYDSYLQYSTHVTCTVPLDKLCTGDVQSMINDMILDGCALSTIKHMLTLVRQALYKARALGMIESLSMLENLELPRSKPKKVRPLRHEQVRLILDNCYRTFYGDMYKFLLYTGCRVGEAIALRWCDIDFFNREIHIVHTDYNGELQDVKTVHGKRILPLFGEIERFLVKRRRGRKPTDRVFTNTLGRACKYRTLLDNWHWFCCVIGLYEPIGFHVLRHTFAHSALRNGVPVKVVSAWLGHANVNVTLNIYDSVDDSDFRNAAEVIQNIFENNKTQPLSCALSDQII